MNIYRNNRIELLAPAGNYECFIAALNAGADAVYLGMHKFGARSFADNFSENELIEAIKLAHIYGRRIYLTVNTLFKENELSQLFDFLKGPYLAGLDGVIVQDLGVVAFISRYFPEIEIHASTQMAITSISGVEFVRKMGICRVVPARELSLCEIKKIHDITGMELECFVHGALCYSYSGKCLFSSCLGERSGNRGSCAGPCRLEYDNEYLLSMKDLYTLRLIPDLIEAGIYSFKIEGRMKSSDYVFGVTSIYRKYIDEYLSCGKICIDKSDENRILSLYTRDGNCEGYYRQKNGRNMITIKSPAYSSSNDKKEDYSKINRKIKLIGRASFCFDEKPIFEIEVCDQGLIYSNSSVCVYGNNKMERSKNAPATVENIIKQLSKTGGTNFCFDSIDVKLENDLFIPNSELNSLRRSAIDALEKQISVFFDRNISANYNIDDLVFNKSCKQLNKGNNCYKIKASVIFEEQLLEVSKYDYIADVILGYSLSHDIISINGLNIAIRNVLNSGKGIYIKLPFVIRNESRSVSEEQLISFVEQLETYFDTFYDTRIKGFYVSCYEEIEILKRINFDGEIIGDIHIYSYNHMAHDELMEKGITNTTVPFELTQREILERGISGEELIVYGRIPMLISSQCIIKTKNKCNCNIKGNGIYILDRMREKLFCFSDCSSCTSIIYNSVPLSITDEVDFIEKLCPYVLRIDFSCENVNEIRDILNRFELILQSDFKESIKVVDKYTKGHLKKGVL